MGELRESCHKLENVLDQVEAKCGVFITDLKDFNNYVASYALYRLCRKLQIIASWITVCVERLYEEHNGEGHVCVFLTQKAGVTVHWVETREIVADKAYYQAYGSIVLSPEEAIVIIAQLIDGLVLNNWAEAIDWLNKYGKSPGLDFDKFS